MFMLATFNTGMSTFNASSTVVVVVLRVCAYTCTYQIRGSIKSLKKTHGATEGRTGQKSQTVSAALVGRGNEL